MIVYSFQHKNVLANLIKYKIYNCTYASQYRNQAPILYSLLQELLYDKTSINSYPIFSWSVIEGEEAKNLSVENAVLNSYHKVNYDANNYVCLELDIPDKYIVEHDFFDFACYKADEEEQLVEEDELRDFVFNSKVSSYNVQACFPIIQLEWLKNAYEYNVSFEPYSYKIKDVKASRIYSSGNNISRMNVFDI